MGKGSMNIKANTLLFIALSGASSSALAVSVYKDKDTTLDIYGRIEWQLANGDASFAKDDSRSQLGGRLGFYLTRDLPLLEDTKLVGRLEWQVRTEKDDNKTNDKDLDARYSYLGLSHAKYGELIAGRTRNPLYQVMRMTDKYKNFTPNVYNYGITTIDDSYQFNRQDGTLQWNANFSGHQVQLAYVFGNGNSENDALDDGMMVSYRKMIKIGDVNITPAIAASQYNRQDGVKTTDGRKKHSQLLGGLQLDYSDLSLAVTASKISIERDNKSDNNFTSFDSVLSYQFTKEFRVLGGYSFLDEAGKDVYRREGWRVESLLNLAQNVYLSATYLKTLANNNEKINDDAVIVGLRYDF
jgi:predicted porin